MPVSVDRLYTPTTNELSEAIDEYLYKNEKADGKEVRTALMTAHDNWKLPERRVLKYVKRQKKEKSVGNNDNNDDDNRSLLPARVSRGVKGVKKAFISSLSRSGLLVKTNKDGPPASVVSTTATQESAPPLKKDAAQQIPGQPPVAAMAKLEQQLQQLVGEKKEEEAAVAAVVEPETAAKEEKADKGVVDLDKAYEEEEAQENKGGGPCHACEGCNIL